MLPTMSIQRICRYLFILTISIFLVVDGATAFAQADTTATDSTGNHKARKVDSAGHQLCFGADIVHPIMNNYLTDRFGYEFAVDYYLHNEFYGVLEGGWGGSTVNYSDLKYTTTNNFARIGFNKEILTRDNPRDWDMMFFGLRAGLADVKRSSATFTVTDSVWGNEPGQTAGKAFTAVWLELVGGMRVELVKGLFAGWTARGKFIMNGRSFSDLSPLYIAGYGRGDKNTDFDVNVFISYSLRWKRKSIVKPKLHVATTEK